MWSHHFLTNRWGNNGNRDRLFSWAPKSLQTVSATMKLKKCLLLGKKAITKLDIVWKGRDITLLTKVCVAKAMVFSIAMYRCESWTIRKAEHRSTDAFELWCWRRLLRIPWTARRSNQSILKEISPEYSLEGLMLKLKLQYFGHLMWRTEELTNWKGSWCWERLKAGEGDNRGWDGWMASLTQWTWVWASSGSCDGQGTWCAAIHGITKSWTWLNDQATTKIVLMNWGHREKKNPDLSCGWQATERTLGQPNANTFYYFQTI